LLAQVAAPSGQQAGLDEDEGGPVLGKESFQLVAAGGPVGEAVVVGGALKASDALVFTEVEGENGAGGCGRGGRGSGDRVRGVPGKLLWGEG